MFDRDTSADARIVQARVLRSLSVSQKFEAMNALTLMCHTLVRAGIRERFPDASDSEREAEYFRIVLGDDLAKRVLEYRDQVRSRDP